MSLTQATKVGGVVSASTLVTILVGAIGWFLNTMYTEGRETRAIAVAVSERVARLESRQDKLVFYQEWRDGENDKLAEVKKE